MSARIIHCNYLQMVENSVDQPHFKWLHRTPKTRHWLEEKLTSEITDFGIRDTFTRRIGDEYFRTISLFLIPNMNKVGYHLPEDHPAAFAATHEGYEALRWRVPADDTTTMHFTLYFAPRGAHTLVAEKASPKSKRRSIKSSVSRRESTLPRALR